jgi:8-oxo-dGTP diphosphatase
MSYPVDGGIKIVQFWHMHAIGEPVHELIYEVRAVKWLSLKQAIDTLTRAHERVFLANVGPIALKAARQLERDKQTERARQVERDKAAKRLLHNGRRRRAASAEQVLATG